MDRIMPMNAQAHLECALMKRAMAQVHADIMLQQTNADQQEAPADRQNTALAQAIPAQQTQT
jgi:hypothetical protein